MKVEYFNEYSPNLGRNMEIKVYGHGGKPFLVFPSQCGRFYEYEGFGMIDAVSSFIEEGRAQFFCVDGLDWETMINPGWPRDRILRHEAYVRYVTDEVVPWAMDLNEMGSNGYRAGGMFTTGCSMGALHAANFFFRRPDIFDGVVALSGLYTMRSFFGDATDDEIYFNSTLEYLPNVHDEYTLSLYRRAQIVICCGQGDWESECIHDTYELQQILERKNIPAWVDYWGYDVPHDWPSWRRQMPYFMSQLV